MRQYSAAVDSNDNRRLARISERIVEVFGISAEEAFVRVDRFFRPYRWDLTDDTDQYALQERSRDEWAREIYLGDDHERLVAEFGLRGAPARPIPGPGDPAFGGREMSEGALCLSLTHPWQGDWEDLTDLVGDVLGADRAEGHSFETDVMLVRVLPGPTPPYGESDERMTVSCYPRSAATWGDVAIVLRKIAYRLEETGVTHVEMALVDVAGPSDLLK
ncbi:hypothetical protein ACIBSV_17325 [Embleya sp. NPDC050154]|uniref:hypothetical protein n=1 Tax=Embleya sp. NPDC050154 TaxID=3363988 RepID=UPI0037BAC2A7